MLKKLKVAALDLDGVLLKDTFSPVIRKLIESESQVYTREIERSVFSRPRDHSIAYLADKFKLNMTHREIAERYFSARAAYIAEHGGGPMDGLEAFLIRLKGMGLQLVSYGGLDKDNFRSEMKPWLSFFDEQRDYFCTNEVRPGIREIAQWVGHSVEEILFIDDVSWFGEHARDLGAPFIGMPSQESHGFQKGDMHSLGVKYIVGSLDEITEDLIYRVDCDALQGCAWSYAHS